MNDSHFDRFSRGEPWPEPADSATPGSDAERATLEAGWAALDQLLGQAVPALSPDEVETLVERVVWQVRLARRRRRQLLLAAAMLLLGMGISFWVTGLARRADGPAPMIADAGAIPPIEAPRTDANVAKIDAVAWDDTWSDDLADAQQEAADVDSDWRVPMENWASLRWQMDELEAELDSYAL